MTKMINVAVAGYAGRMGSAVVDAVTAAEDLTLVCGVDPYKKPVSFPTYQTISEALEKERIQHHDRCKSHRRSDHGVPPGKKSDAGSTGTCACGHAAGGVQVGEKPQLSGYCAA